MTIDIDGFDPSIARPLARRMAVPVLRGAGIPDGLTGRGNIVGVDLVEVAPDYDLSGSTTTLAAQLLLNLIGRIAENG